MNKPALVFIVSLAFLAACQTPSSEQQAAEAKDKGSPLDEISRELDALPTPHQMNIVEVAVSNHEEFDGKSREEIIVLRSNAVAALGNLAPQNYSPSDQVFGRISDSAAWWGSLGFSYSGPGARAADGPSYDSSFILNPLLLVGLSRPGAMTSNRKELPEISILPEAVALEIADDLSSGRVRYSMSGYVSAAKEYWPKNPKSFELRLVAINARDFGFRFLEIDQEKSKQIKLSKPSSKPIEIQDALFPSRDCRLGEGCNQLGPRQPEFEFTLQSLPARIYVKLWRAAPAAGRENADCAFLLDLS